MQTCVNRKRKRAIAEAEAKAEAEAAAASAVVEAKATAASAVTEAEATAASAVTEAEATAASAVTEHDNKSTEEVYRLSARHRKVLVVEASPVPPSDSDGYVDIGHLVPGYNSQPLATHSQPVDNDGVIRVKIESDSEEETAYVECPDPRRSYYFVRRSTCLVPTKYHCTLESCLIRVGMWKCHHDDFHFLSDEKLIENDTIVTNARDTVPTGIIISRPRVVEKREICDSGGKCTALLCWLIVLACQLKSGPHIRS